METVNQSYPQEETFEQFLASFKEIREMQKENAEQQKESARRMDKLNKEVAERQEETSRHIKEMSREVGLLANSFGELAEYLVAPNIIAKFQELGYKVEKASRNIEIFTPDLTKIIAEIDIFIENGDTAIVVEVKAKLREKHLEEFFNKMEKVRKYADKKNDKRLFHGAIAAPIMTEAQCEKILSEGIYAIIQTGDTMKIIIPDGFVPRQW